MSQESRLLPKHPLVETPHPCGLLDVMDLSLRSINAREAFLHNSFPAAGLRPSTCHSSDTPIRIQRCFWPYGGQINSDAATSCSHLNGLSLSGRERIPR